MRLLYSECNGFGNIMRDFSQFDKVSEYLQAIVDIYNNVREYDLEMLPLECSYVDPVDSKTKYIICDGKLCEDAQANIDFLKKQRKELDEFITDYLSVTADGFERECYFSWSRS